MYEEREGLLFNHPHPKQINQQRVCTYDVFYFLAESSPLFFVSPSCPSQYQTGLDCNISSTLCDVTKPCQNNGSCINNNSIPRGYTCTCPRGFDGTECQIDNRPCKPNTCWNNGI